MQLATTRRALEARQIDVRLRARFPILTTRIFELAEGQFLIFFDRDILDAREIRATFDHEVRYATSLVSVSNNLPPDPVRELVPIDDHSLAQDGGLPYTQNDLELLVAGRFPKLPELTSLELEPDRLTIGFESALSAPEEQRIRDLFGEIYPECAVTVVIIPRSTGPSHLDPLTVLPPARRPWRELYVTEDEAYWHDNISAIFAGRLAPDDVVDRAAMGTACLINPNAGPSLDIRQALLCYDTILLQPPLIDGAHDFYVQQRLAPSDIATIASRGRLRLLLAQPEERSDMRLISTVLEAAPSALIGRRRAAALVAADLVRTTDDYLFARRDMLAIMRSLADAAANRAGMSASSMTDILLWPVAARRSAFLALQDRGLMGIGAFGVAGSVGRELSELAGRDLNLETLLFGIDIQTAHAFGATLIPSEGLQTAWTRPLAYMGDRLNFYRGFNDRILPAWIDNARRRQAGRSILPAIPLFDFRSAAPLADLLTLTERTSTRSKGQGLITRLSSLPVDEREREVRRLSERLYELNAKRDRRSLAMDHASNIWDIGQAVAGIALPPFVAASKLFLLVKEQSRRIGVVDRFWDALEDDMPAPVRPDPELDFLSRVSRVAELVDPPLHR